MKVKRSDNKRTPSFRAVDLYPYANGARQRILTSKQPKKKWEIYKHDDRQILTIDSSSPSPNRRARSQRACVVDSTVMGSP